MDALTVVHTTVSVIGLVAGGFVVAALIASRRPVGLSALFLATTLAASVTGFLFPAKQVGLGQVVGLVSLGVLAPTICAFAAGPLAGMRRVVFAAGATAALYLNAVIGVLQLFAKVPALRPDGPMLTAPSFLGAQLVLLLAFLALGARAIRRYPVKSAARSSIGWPCGVRPAARSQASR
jgi:hypothetical protein